jgi:hypothetical protein
MNSPLTRPSHVSPEQWERAQRDLETYRRHLPRLLQEGHAGEYALIKDEQVLSTWDTVGDALQAKPASGALPQRGQVWKLVSDMGRPPHRNTLNLMPTDKVQQRRAPLDVRQESFPLRDSPRSRIGGRSSRRTIAVAGS